jgi:hypothetical protein
MADELGKGFMFVAVLLFCFAFFVSILPPELLGEVEPDTYYQHDVPESWIGEEIATWGEVFTESANITLEKGAGEFNLNVGDVLLRMSFNELEDRDPLYMWHVWLPALVQRHPLEPYPLDKQTVMDHKLGTAYPERARINMRMKEPDPTTRNCGFSWAWIGNRRSEPLTHGPLLVNSYFFNLRTFTRL